jgi:hypothetical protein
LNARVNKLRQTEPETQRTGAATAGNRGRVAGPKAAASNGETNRDGKFFETLRWLRDDAVNKPHRKIRGENSLAPQELHYKK